MLIKDFFHYLFPLALKNHIFFFGGGGGEEVVNNKHLMTGHKGNSEF